VKEEKARLELLEEAVREARAPRGGAAGAAGGEGKVVVVHAERVDGAAQHAEACAEEQQRARKEPWFRKYLSPPVVLLCLLAVCENGLIPSFLGFASKRFDAAASDRDHSLLTAAGGGAGAPAVSPKQLRKTAAQALTSRVKALQRQALGPEDGEAGSSPATVMSWGAIYEALRPEHENPHGASAGGDKRAQDTTTVKETSQTWYYASNLPGYVKPVMSIAAGLTLAQGSAKKGGSFEGLSRGARLTVALANGLWLCAALLVVVVTVSSRDSKASGIARQLPVGVFVFVYVLGVSCMSYAKVGIMCSAVFSNMERVGMVVQAGSLVGGMIGFLVPMLWFES
jgi:hypothetical protein